MIYQRKISSVEYLYLACKNIFAPFAIQMVIEFDGVIDSQQLGQAMDVASKSHPGCRLQLNRRFFPTKWIDSLKTPTFKIINTLENFEILNAHELNSFSDEHTYCDVLIFSGKTNYAVFRSFHGVMDAHGLFIWAKAVLKAYGRQESPATNSNLNDQQFIRKTMNHVERPLLKPTYTSPLGPASSQQLHAVRIRKTILKSTPAALAKIAFAITQMNLQKNRFMIPVNLRLANRSLISTGNLSNPIFLDVNKNESWSDVQDRIVQKLINNEQFQTSSYEKLIAFIPLTILRFLVKLLEKNLRTKNQFLATAILSNMGRIDLSDFSTGPIQAKTVFFIPVDSPGTPLGIIITETKSSCEIVASAPACYGDQNRLNNLIETIVNQMESL